MSCAPAEVDAAWINKVQQEIIQLLQPAMAKALARDHILRAANAAFEAELQNITTDWMRRAGEDLTPAAAAEFQAALERLVQRFLQVLALSLAPSPTLPLPAQS